MAVGKGGGVFNAVRNIFLWATYDGGETWGRVGAGDEMVGNT